MKSPRRTAPPGSYSPSAAPSSYPQRGPLPYQLQLLLPTNGRLPQPLLDALLEAREDKYEKSHHPHHAMCNVKCHVRDAMLAAPRIQTSSPLASRIPVTCSSLCILLFSASFRSSSCACLSRAASRAAAACLRSSSSRARAWASRCALAARRASYKEVGRECASLHVFGRG